MSRYLPCCDRRLPSGSIPCGPSLTVALFLLNLRRAGESAGRLAERLSTSERTNEIQRQMLDAASRR
ncbi:hypothetical protein EYC08_20550, partial [Tabrizicola sp. WMC-M-20]